MDEEIQSEVDTEVETPASEPDQEQETTEEVVDKTVVEEEVVPDNSKQDFYKNQYENLQKDYTRKAQELAEIKKINVSESKPEDPEWTKPGWQPKTWQEATEAGKQAALREIAPLLTEVQQAKQQREAYALTQQRVEGELAEIKKLDPKVDENIIFNHANKYGFTNLKSAYQNLLDMRGLEKTVQQKTLKNLSTRQSDPVGVSGATSPEDDTPSYQEISGYKNIRSAASAAFRSLQRK